MLNFKLKSSTKGFRTQLITFVMFTLVQPDPDRTTISAVPYGVKRDLWQSIFGDLVVNLTSSPQYKNKSQISISDILNSFDASYDAGDNFGQRLTSYFRAPESGPYTFYMTCHYQCELWISSNSQPQNKKRILQVTDSSNQLKQTDWERYPSQISQNISLQRFHFYYMEALMKENTGQDHMGIGAKFPGGALVRPITKQYLFYKLPVDINSSFFRLGRQEARLINAVISKLGSTSLMQCAHYCQMNDRCQSYNHVVHSELCELNHEKSSDYGSELRQEEGVHYYERIEP